MLTVACSMEPLGRLLVDTLRGRTPREDLQSKSSRPNWPLVFKRLLRAETRSATNFLEPDLAMPIVQGPSLTLHERRRN